MALRLPNWLTYAGLGAGAGLAVGFAMRAMGGVARPPGTPSILLIGDSHAQGLNNAGAIRGAAAASSAGYAANVAVGTTVGFWAPRVAADLAASRPTVVLISLGGNDTAGGTSSEGYRAQVQAGIDRIASDVRAAGAVPVWLESPRLPWPDNLGLPAMWEAAGALRLGTTLFDDEQRDTMNVHLYPAGYARWGAWIWQQLKNNGLVD